MSGLYLTLSLGFKNSSMNFFTLAKIDSLFLKALLFSALSILVGSGSATIVLSVKNDQN